MIIESKEELVQKSENDEHIVWFIINSSWSIFVIIESESCCSLRQSTSLSVPINLSWICSSSFDSLMFIGSRFWIKELWVSPSRGE